MLMNLVGLFECLVVGGVDGVGCGDCLMDVVVDGCLVDWVVKLVKIVIVGVEIDVWFVVCVNGLFCVVCGWE